jgi:methylated-DNA-protein-cysteine methyltransferase-like protein
MEELWELIRSIPRGHVATYGSLGAALRNPASGFMVGRWMAQCPDGIPWWRVVAKTGALPIAKRDPYAEVDQRRLLEHEGVRFLEDRVEMDGQVWEP